MITNEEKVARCETQLNYTFNDKLLCLEALQTAGNSIIWNNKLQPVPKNACLAVLGDVVLRAHLCVMWYETRRSKGQWTVAEQALVSNANLTHVGIRKGLPPCIVLNHGTTKVSNGTVATTVEALIGAAYRDGGDAAVLRVIKSFELDHQYLHVTMTYGHIGYLSRGPNYPAMTAVSGLLEPFAD